MREGLARELPEAGRAFTWARSHFVFYREPAIWAAVSAIGSGFLVAAVLGSLVGLAYRALTAANPQLELAPSHPSSRSLVRPRALRWRSRSEDRSHSFWTLRTSALASRCASLVS